MSALNCLFNQELHTYFFTTLPFNGIAKAREDIARRFGGLQAAERRINVIVVVGHCQQQKKKLVFFKNGVKTAIDLARLASELIPLVQRVVLLSGCSTMQHPTLYKRIHPPCGNVWVAGWSGKVSWSQGIQGETEFLIQASKNFPDTGKQYASKGAGLRILHFKHAK